MTQPALGLMYAKSALSSVDVEEFRQLVESKGQKVHPIERDDAKTYAPLERLAPTAVVVFIGKAYFDRFLKEMGKDDHALLKEGIRALRAKLFRTDAPQYTVVGSTGAVPADRLYSPTLSLLAAGRQELSFKLLLPRSGDQAECETAVEAFLAFMEAYHSGRPDATALAKREAVRLVGRTVLLAYVPALRQLQPVDPFPDVR